MKTLLKIALGAVVFILALVLHLEADMTASIQASANVVETVGFLSESTSGLFYHGIELPYIVKPNNGSYQCRIEFDDTVINEFPLESRIDSTTIKNLYTKLVETDPSTMAITIIYTEN